MPSLLTVQEIAALCRVSKSFVYTRIRRGEIRVVRFGRVVRAPTDAIADVTGLLTS